MLAMTTVTELELPSLDYSDPKLGGEQFHATLRQLRDRGGDAHRRLRKLIQPAFTPKAADELRPAMREQLEDLFAPLEARGSAEVVADLAKPYPARMIATIMGAPLDDTPRLQEWANTIQRQFDPASLQNDLPALERAATEFQAYARELIETR